MVGPVVGIVSLISWRTKIGQVSLQATQRSPRWCNSTWTWSSTRFLQIRRRMEEGCPDSQKKSSNWVAFRQPSSPRTARSNTFSTPTSSMRSAAHAQRCHLFQSQWRLFHSWILPVLDFLSLRATIHMNSDTSSSRCLHPRIDIRKYLWYKIIILIYIQINSLSFRNEWYNNCVWHNWSWYDMIILIFLE